MAKLSDLLEGLEIIGTNVDTSKIEVSTDTLVSDSLKIKRGDIFICQDGEHYDGHDFIWVAAERGASCVIVSHKTEYLQKHPELGYVELADTRLAAALMWNELCGRPSDRMSFIAVTGTNGKTSVTRLLSHIFESAGYVVGTIGTLERIGSGEMTTPPPELLYPELEKMAAAGIELVILEASSHALAQKRLDALVFELAIFTCLSHEHLDYHGDMESYFGSKRRISELSRVLLVNADDSYGARLLAESPTRAVSFSVEKSADFTAKLAESPDKSSVAYELFEGSTHFHICCPIPGRFTVYNTLAAASAARLFKIPPETISRALASVPQIPGRLERLTIPAELGFAVYIDYAHTPDALEKAVDALGELRRGGRLILLFGCGGERDASKRPIMGAVAVQLAELVIVTSDNSRGENPRKIILDILRGIADRRAVRVVIDRAEAIELALSLARRGDVVLLAGKGHEDYIIDKQGKHPFSEREIVEKFLSERIKYRS